MQCNSKTNFFEKKRKKKNNKNETNNVVVNKGEASQCNLKQPLNEKTYRT